VIRGEESDISNMDTSCRIRTRYVRANLVRI